MDSKQNLSQAVEQVVSPAAGATPAMGQTVRPVANAPENQNNNVVFQDKPKKKTAMILGMVILLILAIGGIGFGVWTMMDGNNQKEVLSQQISDLKKQNSELQSKLDETINDNKDVVFWPASPVHSDKKIYMVNGSDEIVAVLEAPIVIQSLTGCEQAISENGAENTLGCVGVYNTGQEFSFSYNTKDGTLELKTGE